MNSLSLNVDCSLSFNDLRQAVSYFGQNLQTAGVLLSPCWSSDGSRHCQVSVTFVLCVTMQYCRFFVVDL